MIHSVTRFVLTALFFGVLVVMLTPVPGSAFTERIYVRIPDLGPCGPVTVEGRQGQFEALTLHEDIASAVDAAGRSRAMLKTFTLGKAIDRCSVPILMRVLQSTNIRDAVIDFVRSSDPSPGVFASLRLQNFTIVDVKLTASSDSPLELITFAPGAGPARLTFTVFNPDGGNGGPVRTCWDFRANRPC